MHLETCPTPLCPELFKRLKHKPSLLTDLVIISLGPRYLKQLIIDVRVGCGYPYQVHHTCTIQSHTLSVPSSSHLHNTVTHSIHTKFITPAQYSHTPCLYQVHHTCTIQSHTLSVPSSSHLHSTVVHSVVPFIKCNMAPILSHSFIYTDIVHSPPPPPTPAMIYAYMPTAMKIDSSSFFSIPNQLCLIK